MRPSLRQIEAFLTTAAEGSFSRAAERLGSSQPAVSQAIRELESDLALRLFDRTTRRVELTEGGRVFRDQIAKGLDEIDRALRDARDLAGLRRGTLRIAAPPLLAASVLPDAIASFARDHPGLSFELADTGTEDILARVRSGRADIGVGTFPPGDPDLDHRPVLRDALMLFCPPDHPLTGATPGWADLGGLPMLALTRDSGIRLLVELSFDRADLPFRPVMEVAQIATALALVAAGMGLAVLPGYARATPAAAPVRAVALAGPPVGRELSILLPRDRSPSPAARAFIDHLAASLRHHAPDG